MDEARPAGVSLDTRRPLAIAVLAMGGQGGGVLIDWIVALAESKGHFVQATSVPGVAQRTGATIYYVEMIAPDGSGRRPVLSLMPVPGEVDVVVGAELMEAGRAIQRGLVSSDRTLLIASSHRAYAVSEKAAPGDGAGDPGKVYEAAIASSRRFLAFDMTAIAEAEGSVISAALFGALAASAALPFQRQDFEATIRAAGIGVEASLRAFASGHDRAALELRSTTPPTPPVKPATLKRYPALAPVGDAALDCRIERARQRFPQATHPMLAAGLARVVDYQDADYGREYLDLVESLAEIEAAAAGAAPDRPLTRAAAKHIARAMAYDDVIRVADLKTRGSRFARIRGEVAAGPDRIVRTTEYMHPRMEEVCGTLPYRLGLWIEFPPPPVRPAATRGQPRAARPHRYGSLVPAALFAGRRSALSPEHPAASARGRAARCLARAGQGSGPDRPRARRRDSGGPQPGQGLLGYPCDERDEVRLGHAIGTPARRPRRRRRLGASPEARGARRCRGTRACRYDQDRGKLPLETGGIDLRR